MGKSSAPVLELDDGVDDFPPAFPGDTGAVVDFAEGSGPGEGRVSCPCACLV